MTFKHSFDSMELKIKRNLKFQMPDRELTLDPERHATRVKYALDQVLASDIFGKAERLRNFLSYVVEEAIAGRSEAILGKTIAQDVYFKSFASDDGHINVVRVDAGRLRRKLQQYYETAGAGDDLRIHIDSGGYAPWFEDRSGTSRSNVDHTPFRPGLPWLIGIPAVTIAIIALAYVLGGRIEQVVDLNPKTSARSLERKALSAKSPAAVQASNYCDQARGLLFPIATIDNQILASDIFRMAINEAPDFYCGYAGLAHSLGTQALLTQSEEERDALILNSGQMAQKAVDIAPSNGWSQSAMAWVSYVSGDYDRALEYSALAQSLRPNDGNVLDFRGVILLVLGRFEEAYDVSDLSHPREIGSHRFAHRNIHAVASFHIGEFREAIASLKFASDNGDPVSALSLVYLAAAYQSLGEFEEAKATLKQLKQSWPEFRPDLVLAVFYSSPDLSEEVISALTGAGWRF
ncbi:tetratricopeptide repeat protein [Ruegeria atlantica]|nr:tetratricopeptide repeat protein [Ruegeria atlantica]